LENFGLTGSLFIQEGQEEKREGERERERERVGKGES